MSEAARQAGLPLDQWLKDQLLASNAGAMQTANAVGGTVDDLQRRVQELSGVIDRLVSAAPASMSAGLADTRGTETHPVEARAVEPRREALRMDSYATAATATAGVATARPAPAPSAENRLDAALRQINERLDSMNAPRQRAAASAGMASAQMASASNQYFDRRANEIVRTAETLARAGQPLASAQSVSAPPASSPRLADPRARFTDAVPGPAAIEAAVAEIAARQNELDAARETLREPARETLREPIREANHDYSRDVRGEIGRERRISSPPSAPMTPPAGAAAPRPLLINEQIGALQRELGDMRASVSELAPRRAVDDLQRTVTRLAERAERAQLGDEDMRASLGAMREMIGSLKLPEHPAVLIGRIETLERKIDIVNAKSVDGAAIARLQAQASEIRDLLGRALSTDALRLLAEQVALLAAKVSQMPVVDEAMIRSAVGQIERRIDHLADRIGNQPAPTIPLGDIFSRLDSIQNGLASVRREVPAEVEPLIRGLADRIERIERPVAMPDHGPRFDALSRQVAAIAEKLDNAGDPATKIGGQLATIERAVNDLFIQMEETRATILANAGHRPRGGGTGGQLLKREIAAIEANRAAAVAPASTPVAAVLEAPAAPPQALPQATPPQAPAPSVAAEPQPIFTPPPASIPKPFEPQLMRAALEELSRSPEVAAAFVTPQMAPEAASAPVAPQLAAAPAAAAAPASPAFEPDEGALIGALGDDYAYDANARLSEDEEPEARGTGAPSRTQFIAQARRATQPASVVLPEMHSRIGDRHQRPRPVSASRRWLARIRAMLLIGMCGSAMAYGSWHLLTTMREAQLRARAPVAPASNVARPAAPTAAPGSLPSPDDITGSIGAPRSVTPQVIPAPAPAPEATPSEPVTPLPGPSSSLFVPSDLPAAIGGQGLRSAALAGDPAAAYEIGHRFLDGIGVTASPARAAEWFEFAATNGSVPAAYRLGAIYEKGLDGVARDVARARQLYEQAANAGNVRAMHNLGVLLAAGVDGQPDYRTAAQWFARAAERGVRDSQYNLAVLYARGFGVAVDLPQAWRWFSLAAAAGDAEAAVKRDEIAGKLDAKALASARAAIAKWTPTLVDAKANGSDWTADGTTPKKTASR
ncbi:tetratricopeptide repeat protein [Ancylobacter sp. SL191]|uniref:tetratricopeptide repeat protein n=1 Tax=Ancylobacter sp. SL191 TaxID=2995166 RepID=UPI00226E175D|nr:hypothetical protein [Ancylobacter sp. SL191]WAC27652.1 hypothetical protein OU996_00770 [Ancylobacter sp. SL191]